MTASPAAGVSYVSLEAIMYLGLICTHNTHNIYRGDDSKQIARRSPVDKECETQPLVSPEDLSLPSFLSA